MKIITIVGARPQFIKASTVSRVIGLSSDIEEKIVHTGQHYDANMSSSFFDELHIPQPHHHLNIGSKAHGKQTGEMLSAIEELLIQERPACVLVYGDTNSTLAGALAAAKLHIPVAHVEAGLRSFNRQMPEEINRVMADHLSTVLFPPTQQGYQQLLKEGLNPAQLFHVGDVMYDATRYYNQHNSLRKTLLDTLHLKSKEFCLATVHRAENTDCTERLTHIVHALINFSEILPIVLPLHPRTKSMLERLNLLKKLDQAVLLIEPVGYLEMLSLEQHAKWIVTDSGGVQKEAYFNQVPCITLRNETEWRELVDVGWNRLCSPEQPFSILDCIGSALSWPTRQQELLYGQGDAAFRIVDVLRSQFS